MIRKRIVYSFFEIVLGISMFIYGGFDDSPGGQLLGIIAVIFGIIGIIYANKKHQQKY